MRSSLLFIALATVSLISAQNWTIQEVGNLPFATSNNAVALAYQNGQPTIYSFAGIDTSLKNKGIHLKTGAVNLTTGVSTQYAEVPDTLGKVAAGASTVGNTIFVIGGYHVFNDGSELSSNKVHCFNPETGTWEADRSPLPVAIDDHVQAVWNDSLIYIITGWSNTRSVPSVQIYNPTEDQWTTGTPVPDNNRFTAFGASGTIIGNTIYYLSGASMSSNFPATFWLRIGDINTSNPHEIAWRDSLLSPSDKYYRSACANVGGFPLWFGGSSTTYNYNGLAYTNTSVVNPSNQSLLLTPTATTRVTTPNLPMDLRGVGDLDITTKILAGGMYANREVSDKVIQMRWGYSLGIKKLKEKSTKFYPNPAADKISFTSTESITIHSATGQLIYNGKSTEISIANWINGVYHITSPTYSAKLIVIH